MAKKAKAEKATETLSGEEKSKPQLSAQDKKNRRKKIAYIVTYVIALLSLLAGLVVPLYTHGGANFSGGEKITDKMLILNLPAMLNAVVGGFGIEPLISELPGFITTFGNGDLYYLVCSYLGLIYAVVCVFAIFMLIPVCAGKRNKRTSVSSALFTEVVALLVLTAWISFTYYDQVVVRAGDAYATLDGSLMIAFGVTLCMTMIQSIDSKGGIGISKVFAIILSVLSVLLLLDVSSIIPALSGIIENSAGQVNATTGFVSGLEALDQPFGIYSVHLLATIIMGAVAGDMSAVDTLMSGGDALLITVNVFVMVLAVWTLFNFVVDLMGLGVGRKFKRDRSPARNRASNIFAIVRYSIALILAIVLIIFTFAVEALTAGLLLYALAVVLVLQLLNALIRTVVAMKRYKKGIPAPAEKDEKIVIDDSTFVGKERALAADETASAAADEPVYAPVEEPTPAYQQTNIFGDDAAPAAQAQPVVVEEEPKTANGEQISFAVFEEPAAAPAAQPAPATEEQQRTVYIYGGESDPFMETLTDSEKMEFVELFIKKSKGTVKGVPDYKMNEENEEFFPAIFVHINRYRAICSDALLSKMYKQLGKVM